MISSDLGKSLKELFTNILLNNIFEDIKCDEYSTV